MRDWIVDVAIFAVAVCSGAFVLSSTWEAHSDAVKVLDIALGSVACAALFWRRQHPLGVALLIVPLSAVSALAAMATLPAVFNAAIRVPLKLLAGIVALAVVGTAIFPLLYPEVDGRGYGWQLTVGLLLTAVALGWGLFVRAQRELFKGLRERGQEKAREAERRRIAREMHDVLAHRLSILSVHAGALENAGDKQVSSRRSRPITSRSSSSAVFALVRITCAVSTYSGGRADHRGRSAAGVELISHGATTATLPGSGTGLVGLAERVELAGGELRYGPRDGKFILQARIPW